MIEHPCLILYRSATGLEKALVDVGGGRLIVMDAEAIRDMWDPYRISDANLPTLAWAMQAQLWDDDWSNSTKREWIARQWEYQAIRGTRRAVEMALKIMGQDFVACRGYELLDLLVAPQGFFASPDLSKDEWDDWIRQMPELRISLARRTGKADGEFYVLDGFAGDNHVGRDSGSELYGRRVVLRWPGRPDVELGMLETIFDEHGQVDRISLPGDAGAAFLAGLDFVDDARFVNGDAVKPQFYSFRLDPSYDHLTSLLHLSTITAGLRPIDVQFERVTETGWGNHSWFINDFVPEYFVGPNDAAELIIDRIFLLLPGTISPIGAGISFADVDRVGWPPYNAELLVDLCTVQHARYSWIANDTAPGESFAVPDDWSDFDRALRALKGPGSATCLRDKIMVDFDSMRPLQFRDPIYYEPWTLFGEHRRNWLN